MEEEEGCEKQYVDGLMEYIHKCDPKKWSKLKVDDFLEKIGLDVSKLYYFFVKPGMSLGDGLVRLFDNNSLMEIVGIRVQAGLIDLYVVEGNGVVDMGGEGANEVLVSQLTQEHTHSPVRRKVARELLFEEPQDGLLATDCDEDGGDYEPIDNKGNDELIDNEGDDGPIYSEDGVTDKGNNAKGKRKSVGKGKEKIKVVGKGK